MSDFIRRNREKNMVSVIVKIVILMLILHFVVFNLISGIVGFMYYNPTSTSQSEPTQFMTSDFAYDVKAYISLNVPGYVGGFMTNATPKGFGDYEVHYELKNLFTSKEEVHFGEIKKSRLDGFTDGLFTVENRLFKDRGFEEVKLDYKLDDEDVNDSIGTMYDERTEYTIDVLEKLNSESYTAMSLVFSEDIDMVSYYKMEEDHKAVNFKWVGVRTIEENTQWLEHQPIHLIGFNPNFNAEGSSNRRPNDELYPMFNFDLNTDKLTGTYVEGAYENERGQMFASHFRSRLAYMSTRETFVKMFDYNSKKIEFYKKSLAYIDEHGVKSYGVVVYGRPKDLLDYIEASDYKSIRIIDVLPLKPELYYKD